MIEFEFNVEDCAEDETYYEICSLIQLVYRFDGTRHSNSIFMDDIDEKLNELSDGQIRVRYWVVNEKLHCTPYTMILNFVTNTRTKEKYLKYEQIGGNKEMKNNKRMTKKQEQLLNEIFNHIQSSDYNPKEYSDQLLDSMAMWDNNTVSMNCEDAIPHIENNHILYVLLHSKGRRACLLLSLDQTIFYHSQSPGFKEDVTFIMADYAAELTKNYQGQMIHEKHTYYKHNPDYKITYGIGTIIQREKHEYIQEITILTMYAQEPLETTFKIPLEKMPPLQRRNRE